jgi:hypothetical protein
MCFDSTNVKKKKDSKKNKTEEFQGEINGGTFEVIFRLLDKVSRVVKFIHYSFF